MKNKWKNSIETWEPINETKMKIQINLNGMNTVILGEYVPTGEIPIAETENFMEKLQQQ